MSLSSNVKKVSAAVLLTGALLASFNVAANPFSLTSPAGYLNPHGPNFLYGGSSVAAAQEDPAAAAARRQDIFAKYANPAVNAKTLSYQLGTRVTAPVLAECRAKIDKLNLDVPAAEKGEKTYDCVSSIPQYDPAGAALVLAVGLGVTGSVFAFAGQAQKKEDKKKLGPKV